jgi:predicted metal-dependent hydrolase
MRVEDEIFGILVQFISTIDTARADDTPDKVSDKSEIYTQTVRKIQSIIERKKRKYQRANNIRIAEALKKKVEEVML